MKPVAWYRIEGTTHAVMPYRSNPDADKHGWTPAYTSNQLRAAQVAILWEAAEQWVDEPGEDAYSFLHRMINELEKQK